MKFIEVLGTETDERALLRIDKIEGLSINPEGVIKFILPFTDWSARNISIKTILDICKEYDVHFKELIAANDIKFYVKTDSIIKITLWDKKYSSFECIGHISKLQPNMWEQLIALDDFTIVSLIKDKPKILSLITENQDENTQA